MDPRAGWASSVWFPLGLFKGEPVEIVNCGMGAVPGAPRGEFARVNLHGFDDHPCADSFRGLIRAAVEPYVIGAGEVRLEDTPEGFIVLPADKSPKDGCHDLIPLEITPQMMEEFRSLFQDWRDSYPTWDCLETGGTGDLERLASLVLRWAQTEIRGASTGSARKRVP